MSDSPQQRHEAGIGIPTTGVTPAHAPDAGVRFSQDGQIHLDGLDPLRNNGSLSRPVFQAYCLHTRIMLDPAWFAETLDWGGNYLRAQAGLPPATKTIEDARSDLHTAIIGIMSAYTPAHPSQCMPEALDEMFRTTLAAAGFDLEALA